MAGIAIAVGRTRRLTGRVVRLSPGCWRSLGPCASSPPSAVPRHVGGPPTVPGPGNTVGAKTRSSTPGPTNQRNGAAARVCMKALERSTKAGRRNIDHLPDLAQRRLRRNEFLKINMAEQCPARPGRPAHHTSRLRFGRREACSKNHAKRRVSRQPPSCIVPRRGVTFGTSSGVLFGTSLTQQRRDDRGGPSGDTAA